MYWVKLTSVKRPLMMWCYSVEEGKHSTVLIRFQSYSSLCPSAMPSPVPLSFLPYLRRHRIDKRGWSWLTELQRVKPLAKQFLLKEGLGKNNRILWYISKLFLSSPHCQNPKGIIFLIIIEQPGRAPRSKTHRSMGASLESLTHRLVHGEPPGIHQLQ